MAISGINARLVMAFTTDDYFVDKNTGLPLNGGTIEFYSDAVNPTTPKNVYQLSGSFGSYTYASLGSTLTLNNSGQIVDANNAPVPIYFYPYSGSPNDSTLSDTIDLYYMRVKDSSGTVQYTWSAVPNIATGNDALTSFENYDNQFSNPQFTDTFIGNSETITYTLTSSVNDGVYPFAPGWDFLISTGTSGTVTVTRTAVTGTAGFVTNMPYYITVTTSSGITACKLRQRFDANAGLWATNSTNNRYLIAGVAARAVGSNVDLEIVYLDDGNAALSIMTKTATTSGFTFLKDNDPILVPTSNNSNSGTEGYVDVYLSIPSPATVDVSSFMLVPTYNNTEMASLKYEERSSNRETALLGDWYLPRIPDVGFQDLLTGWNFPLNPAQWGETGTLSNTVSISNYIWDQTIALDTAGTVTYARDSVSGGLEFTTVTGAQNSFCIAQYLTGNEVKQILNSKLALNVNGYRQGGGAVTMRAYLYRAASSAAFPSLGTPAFIVSTRNTDGTVSGEFTGWTEIARSNMPTASCTLNAITANNEISDAANNYGFNNWQITDNTQLSDTAKFCVLLTFSYATASTVVTINSVTLCRGDIPCLPSLKTAQEVFEDCRYYYEKSFEPGQVPGTSTSTANIKSAGLRWQNNGGVGEVVANMFTLEFEENKVAVPTMSFYSPGGTTVNRVGVYMQVAAVASLTAVAHSTYFSAYQTGTDCITYAPVNTTSVVVNSGLAIDYGNTAQLAYHYVADARLGK